MPGRVPHGDLKWLNMSMFALEMVFSLSDYLSIFSFFQLIEIKIINSNQKLMSETKQKLNLITCCPQLTVPSDVGIHTV